MNSNGPNLFLRITSFQTLSALVFSIGIIGIGYAEELSLKSTGASRPLLAGSQKDEYGRTSTMTKSNASSLIEAEDIKLYPAEMVQMSSEKLASIDGVLEKYISSEDIQGAVVAVSRYGRTVYFSASGFSNLNTRLPMERDNIFHMASSTKPVLGVAAMIAVQRGLMSLDDAVERYLPEFRDIRVAVLKKPEDINVSPSWVLNLADTWGLPEILGRFLGGVYAYFTDIYFYVPPHRTVAVDRPLTIHDLLTHTSGLGSGGLGTAVSDWNRIDRFKSSEETLASFVEKVSGGPLDFQPGTRWAYSGTVGLDVVARIIEIASQQSFQDFVQDNIFDPLKMKDTHWNIPAEKHSRVVVIENDKGGWGNKNNTYFSGSIGLASTAADYLRFEKMLVNGGTLFGKTVLAEDSVALMSSNQVGSLYAKSSKGPKGEGFGYTVSVTLDSETADLPRSAGSFGWAGVTGTISWSEPKKGLAVVIMVQQPNWDLNREISEAINMSLLD